MLMMEPPEWRMLGTTALAVNVSSVVNRNNNSLVLLMYSSWVLFVEVFFDESDSHLFVDEQLVDYEHLQDTAVESNHPPTTTTIVSI